MELGLVQCREDYLDHRWLMTLALCAKVASTECSFKGQVVQHYNIDQCVSPHFVNIEVQRGT